MSVAKLKESIQEVIVFLRTLGDFRIPAVIERRRKELLQHLLELQGESSRDKPKSLEAAAAEKEKVTQKKVEKPEPPPEKKEKAKEEEEDEKPKSPSKSPTKRLEKRDSTHVSGLLRNFETLEKAARKEEIAETPKTQWVTLKKVAKPQDFPDTEKDEDKKDQEQDKLETSIKEPTPKPSPEPSPAPEEEAPEVTLRAKDNGELKPERPSSAASIENQEVTNAAEEDKGGKRKKKIKLGIFKKGKRDKSPAPVAAAAETHANGDIEGEKSGGSEVEEVEEPQAPQEEGVKLVMTLERKTRAAFGHKWVKMEVKLKESTLYAGDKEMNLTGCAVTTTDNGFEVSHPDQKNMHFKVEGNEAKDQWVTALNETIEQCTPKEQKEVPEETQEDGKTEDIPSITVEEPTAPQEEHGTPIKKRKESKAALKPTAQNRLPDHGVEMKGYIYRKKAGLGNRWDKTYCILTYQAVYFTTVEDNKEYNHMLPLSSDVTGSLSPKKGHDKSSQGLSLKVGKKSEHLSIESKAEFDQWTSALERVLGIGGVEELLSEDENLDETALPPDVGGEELYEELDIDLVAAPPVPQSPRPARASIPEPDDIIIDEDIYEETDDLDLPEDLRVQVQQQSYHKEPAPVLPERNQPPKKDTTPAPSLPPRSAPTIPIPALPPRNSLQPSKKTVEPPKKAVEPQKSVVPGPQKPVAKKAPAPPPPAAEEEEDLYDDVVTTNKVEDDDQEMYEDVVVPHGQDGIEEELYDDVVGATAVAEPITEEFYEDMAPGTANEPQEDYVVMEHGQQDDGEQELYVDVEEPTASIKVNTQSKPASSPKPTTKSHTFSRMFGPKGGKTQLHSGALSYKGPKKSSKFENKWGVIEGNTLQIFKSSSDKRSQEKLSLSDYGLNSGSPETGAGEFAFRLTKGDKVHHFSCKTQEDMQGWVEVLKGLTKYAAITMNQQESSEEQVYQASEDHIADTDEELTFKKGTYLKLIRKESDGMWFGQIGNEEHVFEGKKGKFPANKVIVAEDLYF